LLQELVKTSKGWRKTLVNTETGEIYETTDFEEKAKRLRKVVNKFCDIYEPLYKERKVSVWHITLTRTEGNAIKKVIRHIKQHIAILGYLWVKEYFRRSKLPHIHLCIATPRVRITKLPPWAFAINNIIKSRSEVRFVKKSIRNYLSNYLKKAEQKILLGTGRIFGISRKLLTPT